MNRNIFLKENKNAWGPIFSMFGGNTNSAIIMSDPAWISLRKSHPPYPVSSEYQVKGWATVCIIAQQPGLARADETRSRALGLLKLLLRTTAGGAGNGDACDTPSPCVLSAAARQEAEECEGAQCAHAFGCLHLQKILSDAMANEDGPIGVAKSIVSCLQQRKHCIAAVYLFADVTSKFMIMLSDNFDIIGTANPIAVDYQLR